MSRFKTLSIIIPAYNEEKFVETILERVVKADSSGLTKEIIVVDDGSHDKTPEILKKTARKYKKQKVDIKIILKEKNEGKGAALKTGFLESTGDIVLVQDADLEYDPSDYPKLLAPVLEGKADVVYGSRFTGAEPHRALYFWHYVGNKILTTFSNMLTNINLTDMETCYKAFTKEVVKNLTPKLESQRFGFEPEITARVVKAGYRIYEVGVSYSGRTYEEGKKIGWKDGVRTLWEIVKFNLL